MREACTRWALVSTSRKAVAHFDNDVFLQIFDAHHLLADGQL